MEWRNSVNSNPSQEPMTHKLMYHRSRRTVKANGHKLLVALTGAGWNWD